MAIQYQLKGDNNFFQRKEIRKIFVDSLTTKRVETRVCLISLSLSQSKVKFNNGSFEQLRLWKRLSFITVCPKYFNLLHFDVKV